MKLIRIIGQSMAWIALAAGVLLVLGITTDILMGKYYPRIYCKKLPWDVLVQDYKARDHHMISSGACLMTLVQSVEQADEVVLLAKSEGDESTVQVASATRAEIISRVFAEARTCDEVKEAWHTTRQDIRVTLRQKDYDRAIVICDWPKIRVE